MTEKKIQKARELTAFDKKLATVLKDAVNDPNKLQELLFVMFDVMPIRGSADGPDMLKVLVLAGDAVSARLERLVEEEPATNVEAARVRALGSFLQGICGDQLPDQLEVLRSALRASEEIEEVELDGFGARPWRLSGSV